MPQQIVIREMNDARFLRLTGLTDRSPHPRPPVPARPAHLWRRVVAVVAVLAGSLAAPSVSSGAPGDFSVAGVVRDENGTPVQGASVSLRAATVGAGGAVIVPLADLVAEAATTTDASGAFSFANVPSGASVAVFASDPGGTRAAQPLMALEVAPSGHDVVLRPAGTFSGTLSDQSATSPAALPERLVVRRLDNTATPWFTVAVAPDGTYVTPLLPDDGTYSLAALVTDQPTWVAVPTAPASITANADTTLDLVVDPPASVIGRVMAGATPVEGALVAFNPAVECARSAAGSLCTPATPTTALGTFLLPAVADGLGDVTVVLPGGVTVAATVAVPATSAAQVDVGDIVVDVGTLAGSVTYNGVPSESTVRVYPPGVFPLGAPVATTTSSGGNWSIPIAPGNYLVGVEVASFQYFFAGVGMAPVTAEAQAAEVMVGTGMPTFVSMSVTSGGGPGMGYSVSGTVRNESLSDMVGVEVELVSTGFPAVVRASTVTDAFGGYQFDGRPVGEQSLVRFTDPAALRAALPRFVSSFSMSTVTLMRPAGSLSGTVVDSATSGTPAVAVERVVVRALSPAPAPGQPDIVGEVGAEVAVEPDGTWQIPLLPADTYEIAAFDPTGAWVATPRTESVGSDGGDTGDVELQVAPPGTVSGRVTDGSNPLANVLVSLQPTSITCGLYAAQTLCFPASVVTGADGTFTLGPAAAGTRSMSVIPQSPFVGASPSVSIAAGGVTAVGDIVVGAGATLAGTVRLNGQPFAANVQVLTSLPFGAYGGGTSDAAGGYEFTGLPAGSYYLAVVVGPTRYFATSGGQTSADPNAAQPVVLAGGAALTGLDLNVSADVGTLRVEVTDAGTGLAIVGAGVSTGAATGSTGVDGSFTATVAPGAIFVFAQAPPWYGSAFAGANVVANETTTLQVTLAAQQPYSPPPVGTSMTSLGTSAMGLPTLNPAAPVQLVTSGCAGGTATFTVVQASTGTVVSTGTLAEGTPGVYSGSGPATGASGLMNVSIAIDCPGATPDESVLFDAYIDPAGTIMDQDGDPIEGATATLYRSDDANGPFTVVPDGSVVMSPENRTNPDTTEADGRFQWLTISGFYKVRAEAPGCHRPGDESTAWVETQVLPVPPEWLDLELVLECGEPLFVPVSHRVMDTRAASKVGSVTGPLVAGQEFDVQVAGVGGVPVSGVGSVIVNLTSTEATAAGFISAWEAGVAWPGTSSLNVDPMTDTPNLAVVKVSADGRIRVRSSAGTGHLLIDIVGWVPVGSDLTSVSHRVMDTRAASKVGSVTGPLVAGQEFDVQVAGVGGVPVSGVGSVIVNLTSTEATAAGFISAWEAGVAWPGTSSLNVDPMTDTPNLAVVKVSADGRIRVRSSAGTGHLLIDVVGWVAA